MGPRGSDGLAVEPDEVLVRDATHKVGGEALENGHRRDGLEPSILKAAIVVALPSLYELAVFLLKVELGLGIVGFRDDDLEDREGLTSGIDTGEDLAGDVDRVIGDLDYGEVVTGETLAVGLNPLPLLLGVEVEVGDVQSE